MNNKLNIIILISIFFMAQIMPAQALDSAEKQLEESIQKLDNTKLEQFENEIIQDLSTDDKTLEQVQSEIDKQIIDKVMEELEENYKKHLISESEKQTDDTTEEHVFDVNMIIKSGIEKNQYLSLDTCLEIAILNNPRIQAAIKNTDVYEHKIGQVMANYFPKLNFSTGYSGLDQSTADTMTKSFNIANVGISQLIYDFGKTSTNIDIHKTNLDSVEAELKAIINNIVFDVKKAYFELLFAFHKQEVMDESVEQFKQHLEQAESFYEVGTRSKIDVLTAEVNYSNAKLEYVKSKNAVDAAFAKLNNTMGLPESPVYFLTGELSYIEQDVDFQNLIDTAYNNRPDLQSVMLQTEASKKRINLAKKDYLPSIEGGAGYNVKNISSGPGSDTNNSWNFGVSMDLPILNAYLTKKKVNEAKASHEKQTYEAQMLKDELYFEVRQAYIDFIEAKKTVPTSEVILKQAQANYDLAKGRYEVGVGNPVELKDAELTHRNAKLSHYNALYNYNVALARLENVIGSHL